MSEDKKKKRAVPKWTPHPMPGMLEQTGPSAEAREQLIAAGIWRSDAPNRVVAPRGSVQREPLAPAPLSDVRSVEVAAPATAPAAPAHEQHAPSPSFAPLHGHEDAQLEREDHVRHMPMQDEQIVLGLDTPARDQEPSVVPTPFAPERRRADAAASVAPTPFVPDPAQPEGVAPTPAPVRRPQPAGVAPTPARSVKPRGVAPTPVSPRRQRRGDAIPTPAIKERRRADTAASVAPTPPRPRQRRNSSTPGKTQSPRRDEDHEAGDRVRRTLRISPQVDRHLHALAQLLGLDLNGALSVAIVEHHIYLLNRRDPKDGVE